MFDSDNGRSHCSYVFIEVLFATWCIILCVLLSVMFKDIELLTDEITLPPDRPVCGFYNELCPVDNSGNFKGHVACIVIGAAYCYRRNTFVVCVSVLSQW